MVKLAVDTLPLIRVGIQIIFFLFLHEDVCCGTSNEYPQHMFCGEIRKISILFGEKKQLMKIYVTNFVTIL